MTRKRTVKEAAEAGTLRPPPPDGIRALYITRTFTVRGATFLVREPIGFDLSDARYYSKKLIDSGAIAPDNDRDFNRAWDSFIPAVVQTDSVTGDPGIPWVTGSCTEAEIAAAYKAFGEDYELAGAFLMAFEQIDKERVARYVRQAAQKEANSA